MDRNIHIALNSMRNLSTEMRVNAQNMANLNVPGFRADLNVTREASFLTSLDQYQSRVYSQRSQEALFSDDTGSLQSTGSEMDAAIRGKGYFFVEPALGGDKALSRRGDLGFDDGGFLVDGAGNRLLDTELEPIKMPPTRRIVVEETGQIQMELIGTPEGTLVAGPIIATSTAEGVALIKSPDGHIRPSNNTDLPEPDQRARIAQGFLESSNVNTISALVKNIESQRHFEMSVKFISLAKEIDEGGSRIMRFPQ